MACLIHVPGLERAAQTVAYPAMAESFVTLALGGTMLANNVLVDIIERKYKTEHELAVMLDGLLSDQSSKPNVMIAHQIATQATWEMAQAVMFNELAGMDKDACWNHVRRQVDSGMYGRVPPIDPPPDNPVS